SLAATPAPIVGIGWREQLAGAIWVLVGLVAAFGRAAPAIGVADSIRRIVHELAPPRIAGLRRTVAITTVAALVFTAGLAILSSGLAPQGAAGARGSAPRSALAQALEPVWARIPITVAIVAAPAPLAGPAGT